LTKRTFDDGDVVDATYGFDSQTVGSGQAIANVTPGLEYSSNKIQISVNNTNAVYGTVDITDNSSGLIGVKFGIDPNNITIDNGEEFRAMVAYNSNDDPIMHLDIARANYNGTTRVNNWCFWWTMWDDGTYTTISTGPYVMGECPHYFEMVLDRASSSSASDGGCSLWFDGNFQGRIGGYDNYDRFSDCAYIRFGAQNINSSVDGTFFIDEIQVWDYYKSLGCNPAPENRRMALHEFKYHMQLRFIRTIHPH